MDHFIPHERGVTLSHPCSFHLRLSTASSLDMAGDPGQSQRLSAASGRCTVQRGPGQKGFVQLDLVVMVSE